MELKKYLLGLALFIACLGVVSNSSSATREYK